MTFNGQFDDANTDEDAEFVKMMQSRLGVEITEQKIPSPPVADKQKLPQHEDNVPTSIAEATQVEQTPDFVEDYVDDYIDDDYMGDDFEFEGGSGGGGNNMKAATMSSSKLNLDSRDSSTKSMSHSVSNSVSKMSNMAASKRTSHTGRDDRATVEQCLDPRTRLILFRLLSTGIFEKIDGCLSTGKEANVYYAKAGNANITDPFLKEGTDAGAPVHEYAVKIYKTSILVFKDRDKYVAGEHRWRKGYCKSNPRKMVKVWAEKEMRNYRRLYAASIPTPKPILLKAHVLVMQFLGENGWPSPRLKDAQLSERRLREAYVQTVLILRHMYQRCRLVHGDFSEYNLLWHDNRVYVIDVSQSVETDHPSALDFLRKDVSNVNDYFRKNGNLNVMTTRQLFEFITSTAIENTEESESNALDNIMEKADTHFEKLAQASVGDQKEWEQKNEVDEAVFMSQFLPRSLNQVAELDIQMMADGEVEETYAQAVAALTGNTDVIDAVVNKQKKVAFELNDEIDTAALDSHNDDDDVDEDEDDEESSDEDDQDDENYDANGRYIKKILTAEEHLTAKKEKRDSMKAHKKSIKGENIQKRKDKIKKKDKKRAINKTKGNKKK
jgi:RIO kinase 1|eukprot:scaffold4567_cov276-Chaetoceros_neogracile.AAC.11